MRRTTGSQKDVYICKAGENVYTPTFTYHGFQYVWIRGLRPEQATEDALTYLVMHTQLPVRGGFRCSDETVNRIHEASMRSTLSNFVHFPTDCPQREKNGWTADAALSAEHTLLYFAPERCYHEWLRNIRGSQAQTDRCRHRADGRLGLCVGQRSCVGLRAVLASVYADAIPE